MAVITVNYFGFDGSGKTVKEAKADAARKAQAFISDAEIGAKILKLDSAYAVISRACGGWQYQIIWPDGISGTVAVCMGESLKDAERRVRMHVAQVLCSIPDNPLNSLIVDKTDQAEYKRWFNWQCRYREAVSSGYSDDQARQIASGTPLVLSQQAEPEGVKLC